MTRAKRRHLSEVHKHRAKRFLKYVWRMKNISEKLICQRAKTRVSCSCALCTFDKTPSVERITDRKKKLSLHDSEQEYISEK